MPEQYPQQSAEGERIVGTGNAAIEQYDNEIKSLYSEHPDAFIFKSLPDVLAPVIP